MKRRRISRRGSPGAAEGRLKTGNSTSDDEIQGVAATGDQSDEEIVAAVQTPRSKSFSTRARDASRAMRAESNPSPQETPSLSPPTSDEDNYEPVQDEDDSDAIQKKMTPSNNDGQAETSSDAVGNQTRSGKAGEVSGDADAVDANDTSESDVNTNNESAAGRTADEETVRSAVDGSASGGGIRKRKYTYVKRRRGKSGVSSMRKRWGEDLDTLTDLEIQKTKCCTRTKCFKVVNVRFLRAKMKRALTMPAEDRRKTLGEMLGSNGCFLFDGMVVCSTFLIQAFRFSRDLQCSVRGTEGLKALTDGMSSSAEKDADAQNDGNADGKDSIINFLERIAESTAEKMPDTGEQHLPFFRKDDVYQHFISEYERLSDQPPPSKGYFATIWKSHCSYIKVRKLSRFAKCTLCDELRAALKDAVTQGKSTTDLKARKSAHNEMVARERRCYKKKREKAILQPAEFCSIIVDGADQSAFGLPHFTTTTKDMTGHALKVKLIGVLEHSRPNKLRLMTMTEEHETGANHVVEAVHRFLIDRAQCGTTPKTLFVQLDNCTRENKNRYFMAYMECLVAWRVFVEVEVGFLPVGHTHEDIDQTFSCTSSRLRTHNAVTLQDLQAELRKAYNDHTSVWQMKHVANWSGLCNTEGCLTSTKNFSTLRYFKFCPGEQAGGSSAAIRTQCLVRATVDAEWIPLNTACKTRDSSFLKFAPDLKNTPPTKISLPNGKAEVTKRFISEEGRINSTDKMRLLGDLRDHVFRSREDRFHWDLRMAVEMKFSNNLEMDEGSAGDDADENAGRDCEGDEDGDVRNDYDYRRNSFVAVKPSSASGQCPFWIGKVSDVKKNGNGKVRSLRIQWYELTKSGGDIYSGKYWPAFLHNKNDSKRKPWTDEVSSDTVMLNFDALTRKAVIPAAAQKHLRRETTTL